MAFLSAEGEIKEQTREKTDVKIRMPRHYQVIMHNDDFTSMEFVVNILMEIFQKDAVEAERLMLLVHHRGSAPAGLYPYDIAVTKAAAAVSRAKEEGFPFRMTVEEA